jgi:hypothetical protein
LKICEVDMAYPRSRELFLAASSNTCASSLDMNPIFASCSSIDEYDTM